MPDWQHEQTEDARRRLVQEILHQPPPRLEGCGLDAQNAPPWVKSAASFAAKLALALQVCPVSSNQAGWYRKAIHAARTSAMTAKLERDRLMYMMLGGEREHLQPVPVEGDVIGVESAAGPGRIAGYLTPDQIEAVGLWRIWMRELDSLNAIRDQTRALDRHGAEAWAKVSGRPFPDSASAKKVRDSIRRRWQP